MNKSPYDLIIGLEVHVQLQTRSKLFCRCETRFGAPPNTQTCPVCIGLPGSLPVMNGQAFRLALKTAVALNCEIPTRTKWDRKNYYYPDLPKGYQISQYDLPMSREGWLEISDSKGAFPPKRVGIIRAHLEEDAGKSMHDEASGKADTRIDLNRAGTPLLEIVSHPDLRSPAEAKAYLTELKLLLTYLDVSDCNMQEGSLRVDANVNLHVRGGAEDGGDAKIATPIVEIKNMNSFRAVERALAYEEHRQYAEWQATGRRLGDTPKRTFGWDDQRMLTYPQREKEESADYRYLPDPDLPPVEVGADELAAVRSSLGESPAALRLRLQADFSLSSYDAEVIVNQGRPLADYFLVVAAGCGDGKLAANWVTQEVLRLVNDQYGDIERFPVPPASLADLIRAVAQKKVPGPRAKEVFAAMLARNLGVDGACQELGIAAVDQGELAALCRELLAANPRVVAEVKNGKSQAVASLIGQAKKRNPNVNPNDFRELCLEQIQHM